MKIKKLLMVFILSIVALATTLMTIQPTYAAESDLIDEASIFTGDGSDHTDITLLENSQYRLTVTALGVDYTDFQDLDSQGSELELEIISGSILSYYNCNSAGDWADYSHTETFETTTEATLEFYMSYSIDHTDVNHWLEFVSIELVWLGNTEAPDTVPPTYTYQSESINTSYDDPITVSEIKALLGATDPEEGDVTDRIQLYNDQYTGETLVVGETYSVTYMVDDTVGNSSYLQIDVTVIDEIKPYFILTEADLMMIPDDLSGITLLGTYEDGDSVSFTFYENAAEQNLMLQDFLNHLQCYDEYSGIRKFEIGDGWLGTYSGVAEFAEEYFWLTQEYIAPGNYSLDYTITDPNGNSATLTVNYEVLENDAPVIVGSDTYNYEALNDGLEDMLASYSATDTEDGTATVTIKSTSLGQGESEWTLPGMGESMTVTLSATDNYGKEITKAITLTVVDSSQPVFKIDNIDVVTYTHNLYMSDTTTLQTLIDSIVISDEYDGDLTVAIIVPSFPSFAVPGTNNITLTCTDPQGNASSLIITVNVIDDIAPVVNGSTKVVKGLTSTLAISDITAELTATDNVDGIISVEVVADGYTGNNSIIGSYVVQYRATDSSGNVTLHEVRVWVVDNQAPAWILNDYFVNLVENTTMSRTELVALLQDAGMIGSDISYTVTFVSDEYVDHEDISGAYDVVMNITYEDGSEEVISVQLNVPEAAEIDDVIEVEAEVSTTGFIKAWNSVKTFFGNAWNGIKSIGNAIWSGAKWSYNNLLKPVWEFFFEPDEDLTPDEYTTTEDIVDEVDNTSEVTAEDLPDVTVTTPIYEI